MQNAAPGRAARGVARHGMTRHGTAPSSPPRLYLLAGVTRGAYFYGLYYFAFLECALPGVNPRPQFGQCIVKSREMRGRSQNCRDSLGALRGRWGKDDRKQNTSAPLAEGNWETKIVRRLTGCDYVEAKYNCKNKKLHLSLSGSGCVSVDVSWRRGGGRYSV